MKAHDFDKKFDDGESIIDDLDLSKAERPNLKVRRVNIDFPSWVIKALDDEATRINVSRQSLIKLWIAERVEHRNPSTKR